VTNLFSSRNIAGLLYRVTSNFYQVFLNIPNWWLCAVCRFVWCKSLQVKWCLARFWTFFFADSN